MADSEHLSQAEGDAGDSYWQEIAELIPHIVWVAAPGGETEYLNQQAMEYFGGWPLGMSLDDKWAAVIHADDAEAVYENWLRAVGSGVPFLGQYRLRRADGEYRWHCGRGLPVRNAGGDITTWIGTATDIDDYTRTEAALTESSARLTEAQRLTHVGSWYTDVATGTNTWSDELYRLMGYQPGEFEPDEARFFERLHPEDITRAQVAVLGHVIREAPWQDELRIVLPGGGERWLTARTEPVLIAGEVVGVHGTAQDITERKLAEKRLRFQATLLDAVGEAVIATDLSGTVLYWGPGAEDLYGWTAEEVQGRDIVDLIPMIVEGESVDPQLVRRSLPDGDSWRGMMLLERRDGTRFTADVTRTLVLDEAGRRVAIIGVSSDASLRERTRAELEGAHRTTTEALTLLDTLQAEAPVGFAFVDRDLRVVRMNRELASIVGVPSEEVLGRTAADVLPPALWEQLAPVYRHVLATGEAVRNRPVREHPATDGLMRERTSSHYPVRVGDEIIGVGVVVNDVTERVRAEGFRSAVMSQVADGVYTQDCDGRLMYMNSAASKMLGWTETELRGKHMHDAVHFQDVEGTPVPAANCALLTQGTHGRLERTAGEAFTRKDGTIFPVAYSAVPLRSGSSVEGVAVVFRDVSEPGSSPNVIRVLVADSDRSTTESFQALLDRHEGIEVVAVTTTSASAVEAVGRLEPHVVLVNADLPDVDGLATTVRIKAIAPTVRVILMTKTHDDTMAIAGLEAGCAGVLDKSRAWVELVSAVRAAYHGETIISQDELQRVLSKVRGGGDAGRATHLTDREEEVLACMREGLTNAQVAERLGVTANTVRNHVQRILYKLNVHSKLEAVVLTSREGLQHGQT